MGLPEIVFGVVILGLILGITAIAQPPTKWVEWFSGRRKSNR